MGNLIFNGISTNDLGLVVQTPPTYTYPDRDMSTAHIPGRNGDLVIDNNCYKNVKRSYLLGLGFRKESGAYSKHSSKMLEWLTSAKGHYVRLQDDYDPTVYRMAMFNMAGSFTNIHDGALSFTAEFDCKPQRYLLSGEAIQTYTDGIENPSIYDSLPKLTISDISFSALSGDILMLSVINGQETVSSITISKVNANEINIDSESQRVFDENQNDLNPYIGLNGKFFPTLKAGVTTLELIDYSVIEKEVPSYETLIKYTQTVIKSEYKTNSALEEQFQDKYSIASYKSLVDSKQETYNAESVQSMLYDTQKNYTFVSFNDLLSNYGETYSFTGTVSDNESSAPDWLQLEENDDGKSLNVYAIEAGYYLVKNKDKKIMYRHVGDPVAKEISHSSTTVIYHYKGSARNIQIGYVDCPSWIKCEIGYDDEDSPVKLAYKTNTAGYFWTDKTWILGKPKWEYHDGSESVILNELAWNTSKQAFVSTTGLITSTTAQFSYAYIDEIPQYEDITSKEERNGKTIIKTLAKVYFNVEDMTQSFSNIKVTVTEDGYYAYQINGKPEKYQWSHKSKDAELISSDNLKGTDAFTVMRLEEVPVYDNKDKKVWPTWLDNVPVKANPDDITPETVRFKVLEDGYYRIGRINDETDEETYGEWHYITANNAIPEDVKYDENVTICRVTKDPSTFTYENDRVYTNEAGQMSSEPPAWLSHDLFIEVIFDDETDKVTCHRYNTGDIPDKELFAWTYTENNVTKTLYTKTVWNPLLEDEVYNYENEVEIKIGNVATELQIRYSAVVPEGVEKYYYKWDSNASWIAKTNGQELLVANGSADTTLYYMSELPEYGEEELGEELNNLIEIEVKQDYNGNPNSLVFRVKKDQEKYFRVNNNSDWIKSNSGDEILTSKAIEPNYIRYLNEKADITGDVTITYIPNWWVL